MTARRHLAASVRRILAAAGDPALGSVLTARPAWLPLARAQIRQSAGPLTVTKDQQVQRVFFLPGLYDPVDYPYHKEKDFLPLNKTDTVAVSEVLADLATLASKAK